MTTLLSPNPITSHPRPTIPDPLCYRDHLIVHLYFHQQRTQLAIAKQVGISKAGVGRIVRSFADQKDKCRLPPVGEMPAAKRTVAEDCHEFYEARERWVTQDLLPAGLSKYCAQQMAKMGIVPPPRILFVGAGPHRRAFYPYHQIERNREAYVRGADKVRSKDVLDTLPDHALVTKDEMIEYGIPSGNLSLYTDISCKKRSRPPQPSPVLGRFFKGEFRTHVSRISSEPDRRGKMRGGALVKTVMYRIGDAREYVRKVQGPQVPAGAILLNDAVTKLRERGIERSKVFLWNWIKSGVVRGGNRDGFKPNGQPCEYRWINNEDVEKIRTFEKPGSRVCWIEGRYYFPATQEAPARCGVDYSSLSTWFPPELRKMTAHPCPKLGRYINVRMGPIAHRRGNKMLVCDGEDIDTIAEWITGTRPLAPLPPNGLITTTSLLPPAPQTPVDIKSKGNHGGARKGAGRDEGTEEDYTKEINLRESILLSGLSVPDYCIKKGKSRRKVERALARLKSFEYRKAKKESANASL